MEVLLDEVLSVPIAVREKVSHPTVHHLVQDGRQLEDDAAPISAAAVIVADLAVPLAKTINRV